MERVTILLALFFGNCWVVLSQDFTLPPGYDGTIHPFNYSKRVEVLPTVDLKNVSFFDDKLANLHVRVRLTLQWVDQRFPRGYSKVFTGQDAETFAQRIWIPAYEFANLTSSLEVNESSLSIRSPDVTWSRTSNVQTHCRPAIDALRERRVDFFKCELEFLSRGNWQSGSTTYAPGEYAFNNSTTTAPDHMYKLKYMSAVRQLGMLYYYMTFVKEDFNS